MYYMKRRTCSKDPMSLCSLYGAIRVFEGIKNYLCVVHGPPGCTSNYIMLNVCMRQIFPKVFVSAPSEQMIICDGGSECLEGVLRRLYVKYKPDVIGVLANCATEIVCFDMKIALAAFKGSFDIPVLPVPCGGFIADHQRPGYDEAYLALAKGIMQEQKEQKDKSVNLIHPVGDHIPAIVDVYEMQTLLNDCGIRIQSILTKDCSVKDIAKAPAAQLNITKCQSPSYRVLDYLKKRFYQPYVASLSPYGVKNTLNWLDQIASSLGIQQKQLNKSILKERTRAESTLRRLKNQLKGKRASIFAGPSRAVSYINCVAEMGLQLEVIGLIHSEEDTISLLEKTLNEANFSPEILLQPNYDEIIERIANNSDIHFGTQTEQPMLERLGIPAVNIVWYTTPRSCFEGFLNLADEIQKTLRGEKRGELVTSTYIS